MCTRTTGPKERRDLFMIHRGLIGFSELVLLIEPDSLAFVKASLRHSNLAINRPSELYGIPEREAARPDMSPDGPPPRADVGPAWRAPAPPISAVQPPPATASHLSQPPAATAQPPAQPVAIGGYRCLSVAIGAKKKVFFQRWLREGVPVFRQSD